MPKAKNTISEIIGKMDYSPSRERMLQKIKKGFNEIASFYGFENVVSSFLEDVQFLNPLIKAGFFKKYPPLFCKTRGGAEFILRPSGSFPAIRMYVTHKMSDFPYPAKLHFEGIRFFIDDDPGTLFKTQDEKGLVMIGEEDPVAEAQIILILWRALIQSGIGDQEFELRINATGCEICRPVFNAAFTGYFRSRSSRLCKSCKWHLKDSPTKILRCQEERCAILTNHAPTVLDFLCDACKKHLRQILEFLEEMHIPFVLDHRFFYDGFWLDTFIFEFISHVNFASSSGEKKENNGSGFIFSEGGSMSRAAELITGKKMNVVNGTLFLKAIESFLYKKGISPPEPEKPKVFMVQLGELAKRKSIGVLEWLRSVNISAGEILGRDSIKSQLKVAERMGAELALIIGQKEAIDGTVIVRELESGTQETIPQNKLVEFLKRKLKK